MPADSRKIVKVFLASPGDLSDERRTVKAVAEEFNRLWADVLGYQVDLIGWEDTVSVFGRPQAIINRELERCELFIGMMWKRWGTAPDDHGTYTSGFEEEFRTSVDRRHRDGRPEISLFFKEVDAELLRDPGPELQRVLKFKQEVVSRRTLYFEEFRDSRDLEAKVRRCLTAYIQRLRADEEVLGQPEPEAQPATSVSDGVPTGAELGDEGAAFLQRFVERSLSSPDEVSDVDVARFRLHATMVARRGNDDLDLGVHDANLIYRHREELTLSRREINHLFQSALSNLSDENMPMWNWYRELGGSERPFLGFYSMFGVDMERRAAALDAMRLLHEPIPPQFELPRERYVSNWLQEDRPTDLRNAALGYLSDLGVYADLPIIRVEYDRGDHQTMNACMEAMLAICLRKSERAALDLIVDLQPDIVPSHLIQALFGTRSSLSTDDLKRGLEHRSAQIRSASLNRLATLDDLPISVVERFFDDTSAIVRFEAVRAAMKLGRAFPSEEAQRVIVRPSEGNVFNRGDTQYQNHLEDAYPRMSEDELEAATERESPLDRVAFFSLAERRWSKDASKLRSYADDRFKEDWERSIVAFANARDQNLATRVANLEEFCRRRHTERAIDVICRKGGAQDLERVRRAVQENACDFTDAQAAFLAKNGKWEDIETICKVSDRPKSPIPPGDAAKTIYNIAGKDKLRDLLSIEMPAAVLIALLKIVPSSSIKMLPDAELARIMENENPTIRKVAALRFIETRSRKSIRTLLTRYIHQDKNSYYNCIHWLDLGCSLSAGTARDAARRALASI